MPQPYSILIEALAQIAASNDSDHISEIARNAVRGIFSPNTIKMVRAQAGLATPVWSSSPEPLATQHLALPRSPEAVVGCSTLGAGAQLIDWPTKGGGGELTPWEILSAILNDFSARSEGSIDERNTIIEIIAAQKLASATSAAISRCTDMGALRSARTRIELERDELRHRLKNAYASAIGLANLSLPKEHSGDFVARMRALAEVHQFLDAESEGGHSIPFGEVFKAVLSPYHDANLPRIKMEGPDIEVSSSMAAALGLLVNELATNALKHGSLSVDSGQILVQWTVGDGELNLSWRELGGPRVNCGSMPNQGSKLMHMIVEGQLRGKIAKRFTPSGLQFIALMPIIER